MSDELLQEILEHDIHKDTELNSKFSRAYNYLESRYMQEPRNMDDDMMFSLVTAYEMINRVLSVYEEQREELRPEYIIEKLNIAKYTINSHIKYQEEKLDKLRDEDRKPIEMLDKIKAIFGVAASNNTNEVIVEDALKIINRGTADEHEFFFLYDMVKYVEELMITHYDISRYNTNLDKDVYEAKQYLEGLMFNE